MEDIQEKPGMMDDGEDNIQDAADDNEEDPDKEVFRTLEAKMGKEESDILSCVERIYHDYFKEIDDEFAKDREELVKHYEPISERIQKALKDEGLGDWSVIAGERFSSILGLTKTERYACYQTGRFSVAVIEFK